MFTNKAPQHFTTGEYTKRSVYLPDDEYGRALDALVKACSDLLLTNEDGKVLIGKRVVHPQPDWWYGCGGRMKPGETPYESAARLLKRELKLELRPDEAKHISEGGRFEGVGYYSYLWQFRNQEPKDHGTADISVTITAKLTRDEVAKMIPTNDEYSEHKWVEPEEVIQGDYHPALQQAVKDLVDRRNWKRLQEKAASEADDAALGRAFRKFLTSL